MRWRYTARDSRGQKVRGYMDASDSRAVAATLLAQGLTPLMVSPQKLVSFSFGDWMGVSAADKANFTRQLATMITAGLPLTDALNLLKVQSNSRLNSTIGLILEDVAGGSSLSAAMAKHPTIFSPVYIALIKAGEAAGVLEKVLGRLADSLEKSRDFQSKVKGAMVYPIIIVAGMIAVMVVMMIVVVPRLTGLYAEFGARLPPLTRVVIAASQFMINFWWLLLVVLLAAAGGIRIYLRQPAGRRLWARLVYRWPVVGPLAQTVMLVEVTQTLALLLSAAVSVYEALGIVAQVTGNVMVEEELRLIASRVEKGMLMSISFAQSGSFPPLIGQMLAVGEETGKMDEVLAKVSNYYESEAETKVKGLTTAIEPLIIILLGAGVGLLIFSIMMPIYNLTSQFS